jgi:hypothetical protein
MPTARTGGSVAIDTVPLPERTVKGVIQKAGEKYILEAEGLKTEIPVGPALPEAELEQFVGKEVTAFYSPTRPQDLVAIGTWPPPARPRFHCVLCYKPGPNLITQINPAVRKAVVRELVKEKIISVALGRYLGAK